MGNLINPPPPSPTPATTNGGFSDFSWQAWFNNVYQFLKNVSNGLYVLASGGTLTGGEIIGTTINNGVATGGLALTYSLGSGESDNNAASTEWVVGGLLGGGGNTTDYANVIVTPGRVAGTTYVPGLYSRVVSIEIGVISPGYQATLSVSGMPIAQVSVAAGTAGDLFSLFAIVPPGNGYVLTVTNCAPIAWFEW